MRLVAHVVKKYSGSAETDDLISVGSIGLIKAINTFEKNKGTQLATYTARCIENEILMLLRSNKKYKSDMHLSDPVGTDKDGNELTLMELLFEKEDTVFLKVDRSIEREKLIKEMQSLISEINKHNHNYYVLDNPTISDAEYDKIYYTLVDLEKEGRQ